MSHTEEQLSHAYMAVNEDHEITYFDIEKCRRAANDKNPAISATASVMMQLIDRCALEVNSAVTKGEAVEAIKSLTIGEPRE